VGETLLDTLTGRSSSRSLTATLYGDIITDSEGEAIAVEKLKLKEVMQAVDPFITPVLNPFVAGVMEPVYCHLGEMERKVYLAIVATGAACALLGFMAGRATGGKGGGNGKLR
jgi:hypothetical protein